MTNGRYLQVLNAVVLALNEMERKGEVPASEELNRIACDYGRIHRITPEEVVFVLRVSPIAHLESTEMAPCDSGD